MPRELLIQEADEFLVSPIVLQSFRSLELRLKRQAFIDKLLSDRPRESIEDVSSVVHETNRIPDPRILIVERGKILSLFNVDVDVYIEKHSYLGRLEYKAYEKIREWANREKEGAEIWFSAPFPEELPPEKRIYPTTKIDLGEIGYSNDKSTKVLLKKAVLLDLDSESLLNIANNFATRIGIERFSNVDELRSSPIFCTTDELDILYEMLSPITEQVEQIKNGGDLEIKIETYKGLSDIHNVIYSSGVVVGSEYNMVRKAAEEQGMMGEKSESCPGGKTAFQAFSGGREAMYGNFVKNCGKCGKAINAIIPKGYRCSCGGIYEGC